MVSNKFISELTTFKENVDKFSNDRDLEKYVEQRLDKTLEFYISEVERCCDYLIDKSLVYQIRRLNSAEWGG